MCENFSSDLPLKQSPMTNYANTELRPF